jgi:RHS repeat-associated protein
LTFGYDTANRVTGEYYYAYDSDNRRIYYRDNNNNETIYFYGADGSKTSSYTMTFISNPNSIQMNPAPGGGNVYFAGILLMEEGSSVRTDRLGSVRWGGPNSLGYQAQYPYGVEYTTTANDREKYATYTRDSNSGMDYAMNRYYSSQWGRFLSPDSYAGSASAADPGTWNRYTYSNADPTNNNDPEGRDTIQVCYSFEMPVSTMISYDPESLYPIQTDVVYASSTNCQTAAPPLTGGAGGNCPPWARRFFQNFALYQDMANRAGVSVDYIMALSALESHWDDQHAQDLGNLFGLTNGGGPNLDFRDGETLSVWAGDQASAAYWVQHYGNLVKGASSIGAFWSDLANYNTANPNYAKSITDVYNSVLQREKDCNVGGQITARLHLW